MSPRPIRLDDLARRRRCGPSTSPWRGYHAVCPAGLERIKATPSLAGSSHPSLPRGGQILSVDSGLDTKLDEPVTITLDIMDGDKIIASCPVHLTEQTGGPKGSIFNGTDSTGWLETRLTVKLVEQEVECQFRLNPKPAMPAALVPLFRWLDACQPPRHIKIRWREGFEIHSEVNRPIVEDGFFGRLVEALAYLQDRSGIYCEMPSSLSHEEAQEVVNSAALMRGEIVTFNWNSFNLNLHRWGPEFNGIASGATQQFIMEHETSLRLEGVEIPIGRIRTHIPSARLADPESVQRDLASGSVPSLRLVPGDSYQGQRVLVS